MDEQAIHDRRWLTLSVLCLSLLMVIMGGPGTVIGPLVGAVIIEPVSEMANVFTRHWPLVLGVLYVVVILFAPQGIVGWLQQRVAASGRRWPRSERAGEPIPAAVSGEVA